MKPKGMMTDEERRTAEIRSIMKMAKSAEPKKEEEPKPRKTSKGAKK